MAVRNLRVIWMTTLVVIVGYVLFIVWLHPPVSAHPNYTLALALGFFAVCEIPALLFFRQSFVGSSAEKLRENADDAAALKKFRIGYVGCFCMCFAIAVYGLVLRVMGTPMTWAAPFFVVAFALLLMLRPVPPVES